MNSNETVEAYRASYLLHGDSPSAVMWPKGRQDLRFSVLTRHIDASSSCAILDYGCGLAHLRGFLTRHGYKATYIGADIVPEFVAAGVKKHSDATFMLVGGDCDIGVNVEHTVVCSAFNYFVGDYNSHWSTVKDTLKHLFGNSQLSLAFNFMTDQVDFVQDRAFHVSPAEVLDFVSQTLSRRFTLDSSYMPYEFTVVVHKDSRILRPDNVFEYGV